MTESQERKAAVIRGLMNRCPNCGEGKLLTGYLTISPECENCKAPLGNYRAADGPAFFTMTIMLLLLIPLIGFTWVLFRPSPLTLLLIVGLITTLLTLVLLRIVKGAFIGYLWSHQEQDPGA
ncbi:DUF983 domain-containing protein [Paracoccus onubensis]|uniref:DUF983 domain-containing protein n=1 Tax=Paracoccus onubensis TaxID=1675788 RepID=UPI00272F370E|nr:DUF983 domain-containing protein [Paracoccus onubensis]MDP0925785.1 DUF983 domain-containing protein [Paracoccus onubensis]